MLVTEDATSTSAGCQQHSSHRQPLTLGAQKLPLELLPQMSLKTEQASITPHPPSLILDMTSLQFPAGPGARMTDQYISCKGDWDTNFNLCLKSSEERVERKGEKK